MTQPAMLPENVADPFRTIWLAISSVTMQVLCCKEKDCGA